MSNVKNQNVGTSFEIIYIFNSMPFIAQRLAQRNKKKKRKKNETGFVIARAFRIYIKLLLLICMTGEISLSHSHILYQIYTQQQQQQSFLRHSHNIAIVREIESKLKIVGTICVLNDNWMFTMINKIREIYMLNMQKRCQYADILTHTTNIHWSTAIRTRVMKQVDCVLKFVLALNFAASCLRLM